MDLGECPQIHDLALRADYEAAQKKKDHFYDIDVSTDFFYDFSLLYFGEKKRLIFIFRSYTFFTTKMSKVTNILNIF